MLFFIKIMAALILIFILTSCDQVTENTVQKYQQSKELAIQKIDDAKLKLNKIREILNDDKKEEDTNK